MPWVHFPWGTLFLTLNYSTRPRWPGIKDTPVSCDIYLPPFAHVCKLLSILPGLGTNTHGSDKIGGLSRRDGVSETEPQSRHGGHPKVEVEKRVWKRGKLMKTVLISWGEGFFLRVNLRGPIKLWKGENGELECSFPQPRTCGEQERKAELTWCIPEWGSLGLRARWPLGQISSTRVPKNGTHHLMWQMLSTLSIHGCKHTLTHWPSKNWSEQRNGIK